MSYWRRGSPVCLEYGAEAWTVSLEEAHGRRERLGTGG